MSRFGIKAGIKGVSAISDQVPTLLSQPVSPAGTYGLALYIYGSRPGLLPSLSLVFFLVGGGGVLCASFSSSMH